MKAVLAFGILACLLVGMYLLSSPAIVWGSGDAETLEKRGSLQSLAVETPTLTTTPIPTSEPWTVTPAPQPTTAPPPTTHPHPTSAPPVPTPHPCEGAKIKRPKRVAPADGAQMAEQPFELEWTVPECAFKYTLIIAQDTLARNFVVKRTEYPGNTYSVFELPAGDYKWRTRGCFRQVCGKRSPWWRFTILDGE